MNRSGAAAASAAAMMVLCGVGGAFAADLNAMATKAPVPPTGPTTCTSIVDFFTTACQLTWYGVRFYGTIDMGFGYQTNGARLEKLLGIDNFPGKNSLGGKWLLAPNSLSLSNIGLQIKEPLGEGWSFVGQVETQFIPTSLDIVNGVQSVSNTIHVPLAQQTSYGDSNTQGKFYNGLGFAGVSHDTWGTLTFGRQPTLMGDAIVSYDPMGSSLAFSPLGFFGSFAGGGDTEDRKSTTALKYRVSYANWRLGVLGQIGGYDEGNGSKGTIQGDLGADFNMGPGVLSADVVAGHTKDAVSIGIVGPTNAAGYPIDIYSANQTLSATLSDNTNVIAAAKYTTEKLKLYAGYEWIQYANPSDPYTVAGTGFTDIAGDFICFSCTGINGTTINSKAFAKDRILQIAWFGAKYALTSSLDLTAAYYHEWQNDYSNGAANSMGGTCALATTALGSCAGSLDAASILLDWKFAPKWDTFIGTLYSRQNGGLDSGFLAKDNWSTLAGVRFRW